MQSIFYM